MLSRARPDPSPLAAEEAAALLRPLADRRPLLAVSGGPDSLALLHLVARFGPRPAFVATVDHGLRAASAEEAEGVALVAKALDLPHAVLRWTGPKPPSGLQEAAREARLALLLDHGRACGADCIVTAHHRDDQAETVLMRIAAGSGVTGLAGMRADADHAGLPVLRPFLSVPKARLVAVCREAGLPFVEDASNADPRFARARWRAARAMLASEGLNDARLARLAIRAARADEALERSTDDAERRLLSERGGGALLAAELFDEPAEIVLRLLARAIGRAARGRILRLERLEAVAGALAAARAQGEACNRTLAGAVIRLDRRGAVVVTAENDPRRAVVDPA